MCMRVCLHMHTTYVCLVTTEVRRGHMIPRNRTTIVSHSGSLGIKPDPPFLVLRTNAFWGEMVGLLKILCVTYMWVYREGHVNPGECWESYSIALCLQGQSLCDGDAQRLSTYCLCRTARFGPSLYLDGGSKPFNSSSTGFNQSPLASTACT